MAMPVADLLAALETISREHPDRVLRLRGELPGEVGNPEAFDARIEGAELLQGPLIPGAERLLAGPAAAQRFLEAAAWS